MSVDVAELVLRVKSQGVEKTEDKLDRLNRTGNTTQDVLDRVGDSSNHASKKLGTFLNAAKAGALTALAGGLVLAVSSADQFADSIAEVSTLVDTAAFDMDALGNAALAAGNEFGAAQDQPKAFYSIISAGARTAAEATETLTVANKLAIGGVTDLETAADGLTSVLNAYGSEVSSATAVADTMFVGMKAGKTTIGELAANIGNVAPLAKQAGVSFDELIAATAALTKTGQSTSVSMNGVRAIIASIIKPSSQAAKQAAKLGLAFDAQALKSKGLAGFMQELKEKTKGNTEVMAQLFGGVEALTPALALTGGSAKDLADILGAMEQKAGETDAAFRKMEASPAFQKKRLFGAMEVEAIKLGTAFSEMLVPAMRFLADHMADIVVVGKVVVALFAVKMAGAFALYVVGLVKSSIETTRYNIKLATMSGLSKRAATQQVLLGAATSRASKGFALIGGKLGLLGIAVTGVSIAYQLNKDKLVTLGDTTASVAQWVSATWAWLKDNIKQSIDAVIGFFSNMYEEVENPSAWDTLLGYIHEIPKNAKTVTNVTIGLFVGLFESIVTIWNNLPAQFAIIMILVERAVKEKINGLMEALVKPVNAIRALANLPPINIPIKLNMPPDAAITAAKADIKSVGKAFKDALDVNYVGAFGKAFTKGVVKPVARYIKSKPAQALNDQRDATKDLTNITNDAKKALEGAAKGNDKHAKAIKAASKAKIEAKKATEKLTEAEKAAKQIRDAALKTLANVLKENKDLTRVLNHLPPVVTGLTKAENKRYQIALKQIEAKKIQIAQEAAYKTKLHDVNKQIGELEAFLNGGTKAQKAFNEAKEYGNKVDLATLHQAQDRLEQLKIEKEMYGQLEDAIGSVVDKALHGFKGVGDTLDKFKKSLANLVTGKGSLKDVGGSLNNLITPNKGGGAMDKLGNAANAYSLTRSLGGDKVAGGLAAAGSLIGSLWGPIGSSIGAAIGGIVGVIRGWLHKKAKIRFDQNIDFANGETRYGTLSGQNATNNQLTRDTAFGAFGVSGSATRYGRASDETKAAIQKMLDQAEDTDKLLEEMMTKRQVAQAAEMLRSVAVGYGNNAADAAQFLKDRLKMQIQSFGTLTRQMFNNSQSYEEQLVVLKKLYVAQKLYVPVLRDIGFAAQASNEDLATVAVGLADITGGFENFAGLYENYTNKLFTAQERANLSTEAYTNQIARMNAKLVEGGGTAITSTEGLRAYIEQLKNSTDIYQATGQQNMITALGMVNALTALEEAEQARVESLEVLHDLGLGANEGLIALAGGIDGLSQSVDNYRDLVFTSEEQALIKQAEAATKITEIANSLGIDPNSISTADGLRTAVDALTAGQSELTEEQQKQLVELLKLTNSVKVLNDAGVSATEALGNLPADLQGVVGGLADIVDPMQAANAQMQTASDILTQTATELTAVADAAATLNSNAGSAANDAVNTSNVTNNINTGGGNLELVVDNTAQEATTAAVTSTTTAVTTASEAQLAATNQQQTTLESVKVNTAEQITELKRMVQEQQKVNTRLVAILTSSKGVEHNTLAQLKELEFQRELETQRANNA